MQEPCKRRQSGTRRAGRCAARPSCNPLDLTKVRPHGNCPLTEVGIVELNRSPKPGCSVKRVEQPTLGASVQQRVAALADQARRAQRLRNVVSAGAACRFAMMASRTAGLFAMVTYRADRAPL